MSSVICDMLTGDKCSIYFTATLTAHDAAGEYLLNKQVVKCITQGTKPMHSHIDNTRKAGHWLIQKWLRGLGHESLILDQFRATSGEIPENYKFRIRVTGLTMCGFVEASSLCPPSQCRTFGGRCFLYESITSIGKMKSISQSWLRHTARVCFYFAYPSDRRSRPQEGDRFLWQTAAVSSSSRCPSLSQTVNRWFCVKSTWTNLVWHKDLIGLGSNSKRWSDHRD